MDYPDGYLDSLVAWNMMFFWLAVTELIYELRTFFAWYILIKENRLYNAFKNITIALKV